MPEKHKHSFGGEWTTDKLERVRKYLHFYTVALKNQRFHTVYVDAFAGTGWISFNDSKDDQDSATGQTSLFNLLGGSDEVKEFSPLIEGSARIALQLETPFSEYVFIEKNQRRFKSLLEIKKDFQSMKEKIRIENSEANRYIRNLCKSSDWLRRNKRGVLFLDPYGMQVPWETIKIVAQTGAFDVWYLFPLGMAVQRLLKNDGNIHESSKKKIDAVLGTSDWYDHFYKVEQSSICFGSEAEEVLAKNKIANSSVIRDFFLARLKSIFPYVASNPKMLYNTKNTPLFLLCFASANRGKGGALAIKVAEHILGR
jgi:three-Cys-motif partner protein